MHIEIVSHVWRYARLFTYQAGSLILHPPSTVDVTLTVVYAVEDGPTADRLDQLDRLAWPANVRLNPLALSPGRVMRRAIGRNLAALATAADLVWFADCDMVFGPGCPDALARRTARHPGRVLFYPRPVHGTAGPEAARLLAAATRCAGPLSASEAALTPLRYNRAIGGVQIVRGDIAREAGYLPGHVCYQRPARRWWRTFEDVAYRKALRERYGTAGVGCPIGLPRLMRIRHSQAGRQVEGLQL